MLLKTWKLLLLFENSHLFTEVVRKSVLVVSEKSDQNTAYWKCNKRFEKKNPNRTPVSTGCLTSLNNSLDNIISFIIVASTAVSFI